MVNFVTVILFSSTAVYTWSAVILNSENGKQRTGRPLDLSALHHHYTVNYLPNTIYDFLDRSTPGRVQGSAWIAAFSQRLVLLCW